MDPIKKRIAELLDTIPGKSRKALAEAMGRQPSMITDLLTGNRHLKVSEIAQIEDYLGVSIDGMTTSVRVMGYVGAGAEVSPDHEQVPPEGLESLDLPFRVPEEIIAFSVRGDSMLPKYEDGDAILVFAEQRFDTDAYVGECAAVRTNGRRYVKEIQRSARRGFYNLLAHNAKPIEAVAIEWVGEIFSMIPAAQLRRARRKR